MDKFTNKANSLLKDVYQIKEGREIYNSEEDEQMTTTANGNVPTNPSEISFDKNIAATDPKNTQMLKKIQANASRILQQMDSNQQKEMQKISQIK